MREVAEGLPETERMAAIGGPFGFRFTAAKARVRCGWHTSESCSHRRLRGTEASPGAQFHADQWHEVVAHGLEKGDDLGRHRAVLQVVQDVVVRTADHRQADTGV